MTEHPVHWTFLHSYEPQNSRLFQIGLPPVRVCQNDSQVKVFGL